MNHATNPCAPTKKHRGMPYAHASGLVLDVSRIGSPGIVYQKHFAPEPPNADAKKKIIGPGSTGDAGSGPVQERKKLKIILPDGSRNEMVVEDTTIEDVLRRLGINPVEVIVAKNGKIVSEEETVDSKDELKIVRVVHGG